VRPELEVQRCAGPSHQAPGQRPAQRTGTEREQAVDTATASRHPCVVCAFWGLSPFRSVPAIVLLLHYSCDAISSFNPSAIFERRSHKPHRYRHSLKPLSSRAAQLCSSSAWIRVFRFLPSADSPLTGLLKIPVSHVLACAAASARLLLFVAVLRMRLTPEDAPSRQA
jgi:hypothetical protein